MIHRRIAGRVLLTLLHGSGRGSAKTLGAVAEEAGVPKQVARRILKKFSGENLQEDVVFLGEGRRVDIAVQAAAMGIPLDEVSSALRPKDFEDFTSRVLENSGFEVRTNFSFKSSGRHRQIDVLALKNGILLSIDCKRWRKGFSSKKIHLLAESQVERTRGLVAHIREVHNAGAVSTNVVPVIVGLTEPPRRIVGRCPIVPIHTFTSFIAEIDSILDDLEKYGLTTDRRISLKRL